MSQAQPAPLVTEPFPGPRPFTRPEARIFKGRTRESRDLRDLVMSYQVVVFHSHSGAGKTSLVNAALLPLLADEGFEHFLIARVGGQPPADINAAEIDNIYTFNALSSCLGNEFHPHAALQARLDAALTAPPDTPPRLLILDQFEELFTNHPERWKDRKPFIEQLSALCKANPDLRVLIVIRDDYLAEVDSYAALLPYSLRIRYRLERLTEDSALRAIVEPMKMAGYTFEPGVAEALIANLRKMRVQTQAGVQEIEGEFVEPVHLQVVCQNLWKNRPKDYRPFSSEDVKKFADVTQALRLFYETVIRTAATKARVRERKIRRWFDTELITTDGARGLVRMAQRETAGMSNSAVEVLEREHVIRAEPRAGSRWYEITHDRFIQPIRESNRAWAAKRRRRWVLSVLVLALAALVPSLLYAYASHRRQRLTHEQFLQAQTEVRLANQAEQANQLQTALTHYKNALALYSALADPGSQADIESNLGSLYYDLNQAPESLQSYQKACDLHEAVKNWKAAAQDERSIGGLQRRQEALRESIDSFQLSLSLLGRTGHPNASDEGYVLTNLGTSCYLVADYRQSLDYLSRARVVFEDAYKQLSGQPSTAYVDQTIGNEQRTNTMRNLILGKALAAYEIANVYLTLGRFKESLETFEDALSGYRSAGDQPDVATVTTSMGYVYLQEGNYVKALALFKEAEGIYRSPDVQQEVLEREALAYLKLHQYALSLEKANEALAIAEHQQDGHWIAVSSWAQSLAYLRLNQLEKSQAAVDRAQAIFMQGGNKEMQARAFDALGLIAEARHNPEQALEYFQKAVDLNNEIGCKTIFATDAQRDLERLKTQHSQ